MLSGASIPLIPLSSFESTSKLMTPKKVSSKFTTTSDAYIGLVTCSCSRKITQEQRQGFIIAQSILKQLMESPKVRIVIKKNLLIITLILPLASQVGNHTSV